MILINLLPHREAARKRKKDAFHAALGVSAVIGLLVVGAMYLLVQAQIDAQTARNEYLRGEIKVLEGQIKEIANIEGEITGLRARQKAVEDLQSDRNLPVYLLNELVKQVPDGVYLTEMKPEGQTVRLYGTAQSNERVAELLRNLSDNTPWFSKPQLAVITADSLTLGPREQRRVYKFEVAVHLQRSSEVQAAAAAATATPAPGKPAPATAPSTPAPAAAPR